MLNTRQCGKSSGQNGHPPKNADGHLRRCSVQITCGAMLSFPHTVAIDGLILPCTRAELST
eukprot:3992786-Pyramimonas_sp.AAC.1